MLVLQWVLIVTGLIACGFLIRYIIKQWRQIHQPPAAPKVEVFTPEHKRSPHLLDARESIKVLATCMVTEQIELSEGCIRIKVLLDHLDPDWQADERLKIFATVYGLLEEFPTHSARKAQSKQETFDQDKKRWKIEEEHRSALQAAARVLLEKL
ncbi:DUF2489 domain-containing protein [Hahella sp. SMD15-11]|uniref:DUF2489 domain-containing protein n=1 Tax=Thermohahella caldifontis TaxID=3142973 RepID=A0AB39UV47_9GAMM